MNIIRTISLTLLSLLAVSCFLPKGKFKPIFEGETEFHVSKDGQVIQLVSSIATFDIYRLRFNDEMCEMNSEGREKNGDIHFSRKWIDVDYVYESRLLTIKVGENDSGEPRSVDIDCADANNYTRVEIYQDR